MKRIACPQCRKSIGVPEKLLGRWIKCPNCRFEFAALTDEPIEVADDSCSDDYYPEPKSNAGVLAVALGIGIGLVAVFGFGVVYANRPKTALPVVRASVSPAPATKAKTLVAPLDRHEAPFVAEVVGQTPVKEFPAVFNGGKVIEPVADSYANYTAMVEEYESTDVLIRNSEAWRKEFKRKWQGKPLASPFGGLINGIADPSENPLARR